MLIFPPPESFVHSVVVRRDRPVRARHPTISRSDAAGPRAGEEIYSLNYRILTIN
jgi:hypothetical protein